MIKLHPHEQLSPPSGQNCCDYWHVVLLLFLLRAHNMKTLLIGIKVKGVYEGTYNVGSSGRLGAHGNNG